MVKRMLKTIKLLLLSTCVFFLYTINVNAYIDPSVMTYAIQAISGIVIALSTVIGLLFRRLKKKLNLGKNDKEYYESDELFDSNKSFSIADSIIKTGNKKVISENLVSFIVICFIISSLLFGTIQLYSANSAELYFSLGDVLKPILLLCLAFIAVAYLISLLFKGETKKIIQLLVFGIGVALFVQGNFVTTNYGTLNGEEIIWSEYKFTAIWNTLLWIVLIILPIIIYIFSKDLINKIMIVSIAIIMIIQSISSVGSYITNRNKTKIIDNRYSLTVNDEFKISNKDNLLIFVLDCYDTREFMKYIQSYPDITKTTLKDFTYYPDIVGGSTRTVVAMPHILTGIPYITESSYPNYIDYAYENSDLFKVLKDNEYTCGVYTSSTYVEEDVAKDFENYTNNAKSVLSVKTLTKNWLKFVGFRYLPHLLKKYAWMYSGEFDEAATDPSSDNGTYSVDDALFYKKLIGNGLEISESNNNEFKLYHLMGNHPPYTLNSDSTRGEATTTEDQQTGVWNILDVYFEYMKELGVYDTSNIVILADHGNIDVEQSPIFFVKYKNDVHDNMITLDVPVSYHNNLQETLKQMIDPSYDTEDKSIAEIEMGDNEERVFYSAVGNKNTEYIVSGKAYERSSLSEPTNVYMIYTSNEDAMYDLGTLINFSVGEDGANYMRYGFRMLVESGYIWSLDKTSKLVFPITDSVTEDLLIHFEFGNIVTNEQRTRIVVNGNDIGTYLITSDKKLTFIVEKDLIGEDNTVDLEFFWLDAVAPMDVNPNSHDETILAVGFQSMIMDYKDKLDYEINQMVEE